MKSKINKEGPHSINVSSNKNRQDNNIGKEPFLGGLEKGVGNTRVKHGMWRYYK
jgi:hypothetical protein